MPFFSRPGNFSPAFCRHKILTNPLLVQSHNTPLLPLKNLHNHCLQFLLGHEDVPKEVENNAYADFWGGKEVYYGIVQVVNALSNA